MNDISISIHYDDDPESIGIPIEVELQGKPILFGLWSAEIRRRGRILKSCGRWTETCVFEGNGCDYLELDMPLERDYRLQRCCLLDHADRILILADTILWDVDSAPEPRLYGDIPELHYKSTLYYAPELQPEKPKEATERSFYRQSKKNGKQSSSRRIPAFRVLPLALPEWTDAASGATIRGSLDIRDTGDDSAMILRQSTSGRAMFAPLFFDLDGDRLPSQYTWRHLTVGENLERVPEDQAVGYRIQLGREQYLLYHSLTPPANRTVLGHNLIDDLCFARFNPKTGIDGLVEVQQELDFDD